MNELIHRAVAPDLEVRADEDGGDGRTVVGIAVPYGRKQRIHDDLVEQFALGAFAGQLRKPFRVRFSREHWAYGGQVIGKATELRETDRGLWGAFRVSETPAGDETLTLIRDGVLDELSIGFRAGRSRTLPDGTVERTSAHLVEVASVVAGAYGRQAKVTGVRTDEDGDEQIDAEAVRMRVEQAAQRLAQLPVLPLEVA